MHKNAQAKPSYSTYVRFAHVVKCRIQTKKPLFLSTVLPPHLLITQTAFAFISSLPLANGKNPLFPSRWTLGFSTNTITHGSYSLTFLLVESTDPSHLRSSAKPNSQTPL